MFANARRIGRPVLLGVVCAQVLAVLFLLSTPALAHNPSVSITFPVHADRFLVHKPGLRDVRIVVKGTVSGGTSPYTVDIYTQPPGSQEWYFKGRVTPDANRNWNFCCWDTSESVRGGHWIKAKVTDAQNRTGQHIIGVVLFKMIWPVIGTVTGEFCDPRPGHHHDGIDIAAPCFTEIGCAEDGTTESCLSDPGGYGYHIKANHGILYVEQATPEYRSATVKTRYAHLPGPDGDCSRATPCDESPQNTSLFQGQKVGLVGHSGSSSCAHLHFEVLEGTTAVDPRIYLPLP